jgi:N-acetylmuramoyl-L-alanine amidase
MPEGVVKASAEPSPVRRTGGSGRAPGAGLGRLLGLLALLATLLLPVSPGHATELASITQIRFGIQGERTRVVVEADRPVAFRASAASDPWRLVVDLPEVLWRLEPGPLTEPRGLAKGREVSRPAPGRAQLVVASALPFRIAETMTLPASAQTPRYRIVIELEPAGAEHGRGPAPPPVPAPSPVVQALATPPEAPGAAAAPPVPPAVPPVAPRDLPATVPPEASAPAPPAVAPPPTSPVAPAPPLAAPTTAAPSTPATPPAAREPPSTIEPAALRIGFERLLAGIEELLAGASSPGDDSLPAASAATPPAPADGPPRQIVASLPSAPVAVAPPAPPDQPPPDATALPGVAPTGATARVRAPALPVARPGPPIVTAALSVAAPVPPALRAAPQPRGVRTIVIDPGHGGVDPGTIGVNGLAEKTVVLDMARELRAILESSGRYRVVLTRDEDVFVPLRERIKRARDAGGELFISLHADSIGRENFRGAAVYTLSDQASDEEAGLLASKENKVDIIHGADLSNHDAVVTSILIDLALRDTSNKSIDFADFLSARLADVTSLVRKHRRFAGFAVLKSPDLPSVLLELGYLSNPEDAANLADPGWRARMSRAILRAVDQYFAPPKS